MRLLAALPDTALSARAAELLSRGDVAGVTLFHHNVTDAGQLLELTEAIQRARGDHAPLLIATDQEGGQLQALTEAGTTPFPSAMALGAAGDPALTERVASAIGAELRSFGVNVNYAPVCDLATNPANPALGTRSFGDDPTAVAEHAAAFVRGLAAAGVAATAKHFPGKGGVAMDTHHGSAVVHHDRARFDAAELVPFKAAITAGAAVVMSGHHAVPGLTGRDDLPATLARAVMAELLRDELGFKGLAITDAIDMRALAQGDGQLIDAIAALNAGVDLLLCPGDLDVVERLSDGLALAAHRGLLDAPSIGPATLRSRLASAPLDPGVVDRAAHRALAQEVARRAVTLVRDINGLLPLRLDADASLLAVQVAPTNLTPADVSRTIPPQLAAALRSHHPQVEEVVVSRPCTTEEIAGARDRAASSAAVVVGTSAADRDASQAQLVHALLATGVPVVTAAVRTPWDLAAYPEAPTHLCTYGILRPDLDALAAAIFTGEAPGRLPVAALP